MRETYCRFPISFTRYPASSYVVFDLSVESRSFPTKVADTLLAISYLYSSLKDTLLGDLSRGIGFPFGIPNSTSTGSIKLAFIRFTSRMKFTLSVLPLLCSLRLVWSYSNGYTNPPIELEIRNKLSLYSIAVDTKSWGLLSDIFTQNVVADYGPPFGPVTGIPGLTELLIKNTKGTITHHSMTSTVVDFSNRRSPNTTTYLQATNIGQGVYNQTTLTFYGSYVDEWVKVGKEWLSRSRKLTILVSYY